MSHIELADSALAARCAESGDEQAFAEIVRRYRVPIFRLAVSVLGQEFAADAEDVAQEVLLRVHDSLKSFRGESAFSTWIYRITFNHALNVKARMRFRAPHVSDAVLMEAASSDRPADDRVAAAGQRHAVMTCVRELPEVYQSALRLHYWLGASVSEIAELLDVPENTVKSYLHRARKLLRAMLIERGIDAG